MSLVGRCLRIEIRLNLLVNGNATNCQPVYLFSNFHCEVQQKSRFYDFMNAVIGLVHSFNLWPNNFNSILVSIDHIQIMNAVCSICCVFTAHQTSKQRWRRRKKKLNRNYTFCASRHINHQKRIKYKSGQWQKASAGRMAKSRIVMARKETKKRMATTKNKNHNEKMAHIYHFIIIRLWNGTTVPSTACVRLQLHPNEKKVLTMAKTMCAGHGFVGR